MYLKQFIATIIFVIIFINCTQNEVITYMQRDFTPLSFKEAERKADSILSLMTLDEKIEYIGGDSIFFLREIKRLGIPSVLFADATQGIHIRKEFDEYDLSDYAMKKSTAFPSPILLASTWNPKLSFRYAQSIGEECRAGGIGVLLGPGMNIYRVSQCGRNFEYFGEDPFLAGSMIENYVKGVQSTGTVATLKHFVANNTDFFRRKSNSIIDERTLYEIYTPAFKAGIDAGAKAVMTSYNLINGEYCGQSEYVINNLLRDQLGFKWLVMTDWWGVDDGEALAKSGQDLEMPYTIALENAKELLTQGKIKELHINRMVKSILTTCYAMRLFDRKVEKEYYNKFHEHVEVALQTAREGIILLKNENNILPIKNNIKQILVTGDYVEELLKGGGSAIVEGYEVITMLDALKNEFDCKLRFVEKPTLDEIKSADLVLCNIGTLDSEGYDRPFELPEDQEEKVIMCVENNVNTVVIVTSGSGIRMTDWNDKAAAILYTYYAGQIGSQAIAEILSGKINPSGKLPMTIEKEFKDTQGYGYMKEEDFYVGWNSEGEKSHPIYDVEYKEGIFVGYRWFENNNVKPLYPFGHGLSYTKFEYKDINVSSEKFNAVQGLEISFTITNSGDLTGAETAMLFVEDIESSFPRPVKELKGFSKVFLDAGESKTITISLTQKDFSFWNPEIKDWFAEKGKFIIHIGASTNDIMLTKKVEII